MAEDEGARPTSAADDIHAALGATEPDSEGRAGEQQAPMEAASPDAARPVPPSPEVVPSDAKTLNKHVFVWVMCFLLGSLGVDRFVRGQIGLGILKLLFGWVTCGVWWLVDWIIALVKAYGNAYADQEDLVFQHGKYTR
jgi:TM2 domain-containing membrane protein YozV